MKLTRLTDARAADTASIAFRTDARLRCGPGERAAEGAQFHRGQRDVAVGTDSVEQHIDLRSRE